MEVFVRSGLIAIGLALAVTSCGEGKLTEDQCNAILKQEIKFSMQQMLRPGGSVDDLLGAANYGDPRSCAAGTTKYVRDDYECITSAKTDSDTMSCLDKAHKRIDGSRG
jgi:hypothetical protein